MTWSDEYLPLLLQLYMKKPVGIKPTYSRPLVALSLDLHIPPRQLHDEMLRLRRRTDEPRVRRLWDLYADNPRRLTRDCRRLREMSGFGQAGTFYEGVGVADTFEPFFRPVAPGTGITPMTLVILLDLYFRLTPATMVSETPEVEEAARLTGISKDDIVGVLRTYQAFDPILTRPRPDDSPLTEACRRTWQQHGADEPDSLADEARELSEYFRH